MTWALGRRSESMSKRDLKMDKYNISKRRYRELYNFCLQYPEWKDELKFTTDTLKSPSLSGMPHSQTNTTGDPTGDLGTRRADLQRKCELIEQTCIEVDAPLYQWLIRAVTEEYAYYNYLRTRLNMPCSRDCFYDIKRKFYYLLDKNKN